MSQLSEYPGTWISIFTIGIVRARWIAATNKALGRGGAGFWFAWFLMAFAHYGVAARLNEALAATGSAHRESPILCFFLTGFPFIGSKKRLRRATSFYNDALRVRGGNAPAPA